jgi:excisionase family DNA binding protein
MTERLKTAGLEADGVKAQAVITYQIIAPEYYFKEILTVKEAAAYIGISVGGMHQYIYNAKIPCYKPVGLKGHVYFKKSELDGFMLRNKKLADYEVAEKADAILNGETR